MRKALPVLLLAGGLLAGCVVGPDYRAPALELPEEWPEHVLLNDEVRADWQQWWHRFQDPHLDALVARAVDDNLDLRLQLARIQEARARLGLARAEQLPSVSAQAEASRERTPAAASPLAQSSTDNLFTLAGVLDYELDLWGRLARERESAEAQLEQSVFAHDAVRLNVIADVVATYFDLRSAERQLRITQATAESREQTYRLERLRQEVGESDELALRQAQSELESTLAQLPAQRERLRILEGALALLVGMSPAELMAELDYGDTELESIVLPARVPAVLPSELLLRRPDIRSAEAGLVVANAGIGVAEASRLPRFNLGGLLGSVATDSSDLLTSAAGAWGLSATVMGPVFDFGRSASRIATAEALAEQAEVQYRATVAQAFNEVRNALVTYETSGERVEAIRRQVEAFERTLELAEVRYREGFVGFIELLDAQRALLAAELALSEAMRDRLTATATLFKALGGGWQADA